MSARRNEAHLFLFSLFVHVRSILKVLGEKTPAPLLEKLAEREDSKEGKSVLKHADIFRPLPALLKKLVWESDWTKTFPSEPDVEPKEYLQKCESTLLYETMYPLVEQYCSNAFLTQSADRPFVSSIRERRMVTTQRRALNTMNLGPSSSTATSKAKTPGLLGSAKKETGAGASSSKGGAAEAPTVSSSKAISQLRVYLSDSGGAGATSYRPTLLYALMTLLIARHGSLSSTKRQHLLGGAQHLHCTLVIDILLAAGGPLPKAYQHVHKLARLVDECVDQGNISDKALVAIQAALKDVFASDQTMDALPTETKDNAPKKKDDEDEEYQEKKKNDKNEMTSSLQRQINVIINAGIAALKDIDPQSLFLNPVTNKIAPGYTKIIKKPMSISTMENKIEKFMYKNIEEWEFDVKLMFKNCIDYNRGESGAWFRGEAERQSLVFREEVYPQARRLYQAEMARRKAAAEPLLLPGTKRKAGMGDELRGPEIVPLERANKKRKKEKEGQQEFLPSMPALGFMILADPFFLRIVMARILREIRVSVKDGFTIPAASSALPSMLQLLHMAQWSTQICAIRAKKYFIPDSGMKVTPEEESQMDPAVFVPYATLRKDLPLLLRLLLEAELDNRVVAGGDLFEVAQAQDLAPPPIDAAEWVQGPHLQVPVALLQGALVHISQPGSSSSLVVTFPKFVQALAQLSGGSKSKSDANSGVFFKCLIEAIVRHKAKLPRQARDAIVQSWVDFWLATKSGLTSPAHENFVYLLNEWSLIGNQILPRDTLMEFLAKGTDAVLKKAKGGKEDFAKVWKSDEKFQPIKKEYLRMLSKLPESNASKWRSDMGLPNSEDEDEGPVEAAAKIDEGTNSKPNIPIKKEEPTPMETG